MQFEKELDSAIQDIAKSEYANASSINRIKAEIDFSVGLISLYPDKADEWKPLILKAAQLVRDKTTKSDSIDLASVVAEAESILMPIGKVAKEFTIHCCGHAHIDMNWCWPWPETVSVTHDTFATVDKLMNEFPDFIFSQSQASVYFAMEEYCPEILEIIKKRIKEGRWESTASMWVEGDKNLASGEILCRHMLYTRQYMKEKFGIPTDAVKIDWECDTFGHAHTIPSILVRGGVTRYYHCRTGPNKWLVWWEAPDKSRVLLFLDKAWYLGPVNTDIINYLIDYVKETGLKDFLWVYGVGDHGGGPTRKDLVRTQEMNSWPIWPNLRFSTTDKYFTAVEKSNPDLPVHNGELNFVFDGCYTSESNIKLANRVCESILPEAEVASLVAGAVSRFTYPADEIRKGWRHAMFNQFHDILPGSGIHATYEYSQGLFQEVQAITGIIRTRALRQIASKIDTSAALGVDPPVGKGADVISNGIGAGAGDLTLKTGVSAYSVGSVGVEPIVIFNGLPFSRTSMVETKIWDRDIPDNRIIVRDETGNTVAAQVLARGNYGGHKYTRLVFPALDVPAIGYKVFGIDRSPVNAISAIPESFGGAPGGGTLMRETVPIEHPDEVEMPLPGVLENRFIRVEVDPASGAIKHLIDKKSGYDYVPTGNLLGVLELYREAHNDMSAWTIGQIMNL
ncbi:MAG TPA: glycoside hydrolase family 38 C-terminal domain-containing protein, partial [Armatimonadota bacterium]|nr:glycoside hydrolase family 38 C-terminal domain-containing protein [Armatimonadota bacterium]